MLSRATTLALRAAKPSPVAFRTTRSFRSSAPRLQTGVPPRKPIGAFRGGFFGFLLGSVAAGASVYYYVLDEYRVSNNILNEDIYALQAAVNRLESYTKQIEGNLALVQKKQQ